MNRKEFLLQSGLMGAALVLFKNQSLVAAPRLPKSGQGVKLTPPLKGEDVFAYIQRQKGKFDIQLYRSIIGAANAFKEGDLTLGIAAYNEQSRQYARQLLSHTRIKDLEAQPLFEDELYTLIRETTAPQKSIQNWTLGELKAFVLKEPETKIKQIMPALSSDVIACLIKLMSNTELIAIGQKVFNPLPNSQIGAKGYMSARVQPNSPTDHPEDIQWQVFNAWSYAVGDLLLGTNPVSSEPESVSRIERTLFDIISTFGLEDTLPNCVLSHIDIQAEAEEMHPGTTGVWFQSLAGTVNANKTFNVSIDKMFRHMEKRKGRFGLYAETGQGADFTNGHGEGFDMVVHEARKYGFVRALQASLSAGKTHSESPWVFANDVAGFIGPEVFRSKEQLVRCCLEDTAMGKLHGLTIGLDICSTLHMDVNLEDLEWCIDQVMPANPAYLMALPTKNDPMLSYLTTAFNDHVRVREKFNYKVNDAMWDFFKKIEVIDANGKPTEHFGDPVWVYYQYRIAQNDLRSKSEIYKEGREAIARIRERGVPIAEGYGKNTWDMNPELEKEVQYLYEDSKISLWTEMLPAFRSNIPAAVSIATQSKDRKDYVYHPESGEALTTLATQQLQRLRRSWGTAPPDVQIIISDGLNARALMDEGHLFPYLEAMKKALSENNYRINEENVVIQHGRVRAGYASGEVLFGKPADSEHKKGIVHIIGERPGSGHHNFSAYITVASAHTWSQKGEVDHNITRVVSGISDTSLKPSIAAEATLREFNDLYLKI